MPAKHGIYEQPPVTFHLLRYYPLVIGIGFCNTTQWRKKA